MRIEVIQAWPRRHVVRALELADGSTVESALAMLPDIGDDVAGYAVFGVRADTGTVLRDGDRLELLRALEADPKEARRRRAALRPLR
ncbi:RnfH family protein [Luteimonas deserti]|uniref:UPF0125 protein H0E82_11225 n=1 Tax=Luteimonas deserti TaxID=2752306 RepID=A0A7Z0QSW8_9GAMM|nr:RnfH family protein [Luteimonas deserti]NYZ63331.1 RnfH family protein [Luteimonas deserti]